MRRLVCVVLAVTALSACHGPKKSAPAGTAKAPASIDPPAAIASISPPATASAAPGASASAAVAPGRAPSVGADACNLLRGPIQLSFTGAATLFAPPDAAPDQDPRILFNRDGVPKSVTLPRAVKPASGKDPSRKPDKLALGEPAERATAPGCSIAGGFVFCMSAAGAIHRSTLAGEGDTVVANGRAGATMASAPIGSGHTVTAFLGDRKTSEGVVTLAFVAFDDQTPVQLSEDGSGATFVALAPRADQVVAMYIDARRALTPLHARILTAEAGKLRLGSDAVLFVGEGTEGRSVGAVALGGSGPGFGLLPIAKDMSTFGLAAVRIDEQPRDDAPVTWSPYPGGIDHAPVAATSGVTPVRVARVRPESADPKAKKVLELGELDDKGALEPLCTVAEGAGFNDVSLFADRFGTLWITYTDGDGTWIERRGKPL